MDLYPLTKTSVSSENSPFTTTGIRSEHSSSDSNSCSSNAVGTTTMGVREIAQLKILLGPKPKRPLSAYNLFFRSERKKMLTNLPTRAEGKPARSHGKCGFSDMAKIIAKKWNEKEIEPEELLMFSRIAEEEKLRYQQEMETYQQRRAAIFGNTKKTSSKKNKVVSNKNNCFAGKRNDDIHNASLSHLCSPPARGISAIHPGHKDSSIHTLMTDWNPTMISAMRPPSSLDFLYLYQGIDELAKKLDNEEINFLLHTFECLTPLSSCDMTDMAQSDVASIYQ